MRLIRGRPKTLHCSSKCKRPTLRLFRSQSALPSCVATCGLAKPTRNVRLRSSRRRRTNTFQQPFHFGTRMSALSRASHRPDCAPDWLRLVYVCCACRSRQMSRAGRKASGRNLSRRIRISASRCSCGAQRVRSRRSVQCPRAARPVTRALVRCGANAVCSAEWNAKNYPRALDYVRKALPFFGPSRHSTGGL